jgi:iron-sulfur cluster repair protein YtfE (RIC family)
LPAKAEEEEHQEAEELLDPMSDKQQDWRIPQETCIIFTVCVVLCLCVAD